MSAVQFGLDSRNVKFYRLPAGENGGPTAKKLFLFVPYDSMGQSVSLASGKIIETTSRVLLMTVTGDKMKVEKEADKRGLLLTTQNYAYEKVFGSTDLVFYSHDLLDEAVVLRVGQGDVYESKEGASIWNAKYNPT